MWLWLWCRPAPAQQQTSILSHQEHRQARLGDIRLQLDTIADKQRHWQQRIAELVAPFSTASEPLAYHDNIQLTATLNALKQRWQHYQALDTHIQQLNESIHFAQQTAASLDAEQRNLQQNQAQWQQKHQSLTDLLQTLDNERQQLFGERDIEQASQQLLAAKNQAFNDYQQSQRAFNEIFNQKERLISQLANLNTSMAQLQSQTQSLTHQVNARLLALGFEDETDYQAALLPEAERERLQTAANQLHDRQLRNQNLLAEAKREQQTLLDKPRSDLSSFELTQKLQTQQAQLSEKQQQLGAVEQQLNDNQKRKQDQAELIAQIATQKQHSDEWKNLHSLIGSSDGKKFRNFAQGLTFNLMINHANEQLKRMSDRYLLQANSKEPLMLNVIDDYQGGEIRTSKNLSGGESFLISLSLALGLSNMASHRMQVDSLFLDEGFGTLDEEALDTALDTLTTLQQSGKLIGVISHIQALKDRISSQIQVVPQTGGVSKIIGAGVKKIS